MTENEIQTITKILELALETTKPLGSSDRDNIEVVMANFESAQNTAALHVLVTLLAKKIMSPEQDIRYHKSNLDGGFSGRLLDAEHITPFLREYELTPRPSSGWQTHSLQQNYPYDEDYPGAISPAELKTAFLYLVQRIQTEEGLAHRVLFVILGKLAEIRERNRPPALARPRDKTAAVVADLVEKLWAQPNAARVPVLAVFAVYQCLVKEFERYSNHDLLPLKSHAQSDEQVDRAGDIDLSLGEKTVESVEVKHGIEIGAGLVEQAIEKIRPTPIRRYYILGTSNRIDEVEKISKLVADARSSCGCEIIVGGLAPTLKYYLRLVTDTDDFIDNFVELLETDDGIGRDLRLTWNDIQQA